MASNELLTEDEGLKRLSLSEKEETMSANFNDNMQMINKQLKNMKKENHFKGPHSFIKELNECRHRIKVAWTSPQISKKIDFNDNIMSATNKPEKQGWKENKKSDKEKDDGDKRMSNHQETADKDRAMSNHQEKADEDKKGMSNHQETEILSPKSIPETDNDNVKNNHLLPRSARREKSSIYNNPYCSLTKPHVKIPDLSLKGSKVGHQQDPAIEVDQASKQMPTSTKRKHSKMLSIVSKAIGAQSKLYSTATSSMSKFWLSKKGKIKGGIGHQEINPMKQDVDNPRSMTKQKEIKINKESNLQKNHKGKIHRSLQPSSQEMKTRNLTEMFAASSVKGKAPQDTTNTR